MPLMSTPSPSPSSPRHSQPTPRSTAHPIQRSFTLPAKFANASSTPSSPAVEIGASAAIETLYVHPGAKIVSFSTAGSSVSRPSSSASRTSFGGAGLGVGESGTLPWQNATERTLAAGPLEIYRVPGSVSFLHSGTLLHAILPRSQCWLVDGVSKFAFRVRPDTYYRLELPGSTPEDLELVDGLKETLGKVLYYERTSCPFRRGFGDELPEMPDRRRTLSRGGSVGPAKKWKFERRWRPEGGLDVEADSSDSQNSRPGSIYENERDATPEPGRVDEEIEERDTIRPEDRTAKSTPAPRNLRSVTAPQLSLRPSIPSKSKVPQIAGRINEAVRTQTETAASTPVRRRQSQVVVDAALAQGTPPTPERLRNELQYRPQQDGDDLRESTEESSESDEQDTEEESQQERLHRDNSEGVQARELQQTKEPEGLQGQDHRSSECEGRELEPAHQMAAPEVEEVPVPHQTNEPTEPGTTTGGGGPCDALPQATGEPRQGAMVQMVTLHTDQSDLETRNKPDGQDAPAAAPSSRLAPPPPLQPSAVIEIPHRAPTPAVVSHNASLHPSHTRNISSDCDYAQDSPVRPKRSTSALSLNPSPDISMSSSMDSWTSLPTSTPPSRSTEILNTLRQRRTHSATASACSSSDAESYHSLTAHPSTEALPLQLQQQPAQQPQRSLQPPKPTTRGRAPSASALIAQTSALLVKRTASIFLGPPAHLVALMLRIAARIVAGGTGTTTYGLSVNTETEAENDELSGLGLSRPRELEPERQEVRGRRLGHRRVPGSFEFSDDEEEWGRM